MMEQHSAVPQTPLGSSPREQAIANAFALGLSINQAGDLGVCVYKLRAVLTSSLGPSRVNHMPRSQQCCLSEV